MVVTNPYIEYKENSADQFTIREFKSNIDFNELVWHRDAEDRIIESIGDTKWLFQFENNLPISFNDKIFIPKNMYHRLIKVGNANLKLKLWKLK